MKNLLTNVALAMVLTTTPALALDFSEHYLSVSGGIPLVTQNA